MAEVNNRPVFKMNNDFWNQARGPPQQMPQNLSNSNQNSPVPPGSANSMPAHSPGQHSNSSQIHANALGQQQQQQQQQANAMVQQQQQQPPPPQPTPPQQQQQQQGGSQMGQQTPTPNSSNPPPNQQQTPQLGSPNPSHMSSPTPQQAHQHQFGQQNMMGQFGGSGQASPDKLMTEKFVNELQGVFLKAGHAGSAKFEAPVPADCRPDGLDAIYTKIVILWAYRTCKSGDSL